MHILAHIKTYGVGTSHSSPHTDTNASSASLTGKFQLLASARINVPARQGVAAGASSSLGSPMASALLQTQDLSQTQAHGGHGGGHHGAMKMPSALETEEILANEEAEILQRRKKKEALCNKIAAMTEAGDSESMEEAPKDADCRNDEGNPAKA